MNIVTLETFLAVVRAGNLNKAADQLNVTQSTVTAEAIGATELLTTNCRAKTTVNEPKVRIETRLLFPGSPFPVPAIILSRSRSRVKSAWASPGRGRTN